MIDNYVEAMRLKQRMEEDLPIPARLTGAAKRLLQDKGMVLPRDGEVLIRHVFYAGDEGGITCDITPSKDAKEVFVISLTHLRVLSPHPLADEIRQYQRERVRRLARGG